MEVPDRSRPVVSGLAGVAGVIASFLVTGGSDAYAAEPVARLIVDLTPIVLVVEVIGALGGVAEGIVLVVASLLVAAALAVLAYAATTIGTRTPVFVPWLGALSVAVGGVVGVLLATGSWRSALATGGGAGLVILAGTTAAGLGREGETDAARRSVLRSVGGAVSVVVLGGIVGWLREDPLPEYEPSAEVAEEIDALFEDAEARAFDLVDAPGLVSTISEFYVVDINTTTPSVSHEGWTLSVEGAVRTEIAVGYEELRAEGTETILATLRCIGEDIDDRLLDTAIWTGLPVSDLLADADPEGEYVVVHAHDGYHETYPLSYLEDGVLVHAMNGETLPREHGFPARLIIPGTWGKINVKWIDRIEVRDEPGEGYWSERGWEATAPMRTIAKLWSVEWSAGTLRVGGYAYAGRRGIDRVEVSLDDGETWDDAELTEPLDGSAVWRGWRYETDPDDHAPEVVVRAVDGEGTVQDEERSEPFPDGATGWVRERITR